MPEAETWLVKWLTLRPWLGTVVRFALGVVWIWASSAKLASPREFVQAVRAYDATPEWMSKAIGYGLPVLEFCLGVLLIIGIVVRLAAIVSAALFVVFLIGVMPGGGARAQARLRLLRRRRRDRQHALHARRSCATSACWPSPAYLVRVEPHPALARGVPGPQRLRRAAVGQADAIGGGPAQVQRPARAAAARTRASGRCG